MITHIIPLNTPLYIAMQKAWREGLQLLTNERQFILASGPVTGFRPVCAGVKNA